MFVNKIINELQVKLINYDWFAKKIVFSTTMHNTLIVYVDTMSLQILNTIPSEFYGFHIVVHFIQSIQDKYAARMPKAFDFKYSDSALLQLN